MEPGQGQARRVLVLLQGQQAGTSLLTQRLKIQTQLRWTGVVQTPQPLPEQHRGTAAVAALQVQVGHGDLKDALQHLAARALGFMPELLKAVVAGVPLAGIEKPDGLPEAGINHQALFL
jgi:hypothetical protein